MLRRGYYPRIPTAISATEQTFPAEAPLGAHLATPMLSIHSLPAELLSYIFAAYVQLSYGSSPVRLRAVCKRWRIVSEATPSLWSRMVFGYGVQWTQSALEWSGSCSLDIDCLAIKSRTDWHDSMLTALQHIHRIHRLLIGSPSDYIRATIPHFMHILKDRPAPLLEILWLNAGSRSQRHPQPVLDELFDSIPPPRLENVKLCDCIVTLRCPILRAPQLAHLFIDKCRIWTSVDEVLGTLKTLPQLETFTWHDSSVTVGFTNSTLTSTCPVGVEPTDMPNLCSFNIYRNIEVIIHLLASIKLPSNCSLRIKADLASNPAPAAIVDAMDRVLLSYLTAKFPTGSGMGFAGFCIDELHEPICRGVAVQWTTEAVDAELIDVEGEKEGSCFWLSLHGGDVDRFNLIWRMIDRWPAAYVAVRRFVARHCALIPDHPNTFEHSLPSWITTWTKFEAVEEFSVRGSAIIETPALLSSPHVRLFPRLQLIEVQGAKYPSAKIGMLVKALMQRCSARDSKLPPAKIVLEDCNVDGVDQPLARWEMLVGGGELPRIEGQ
ncbi:hypothetical protein PENSPDRAFT_760196 [Peniophora sp. CONT]|nr:hypothetical protein PENSPDRAFT_760196 [Peniophora sp. CONT]